jgi:PAS domain S-box-containing protein
MKSIKGSLVLLILVFSASVFVAGLYALDHMRDEAYRQAGLDMERRIKTFWELVRAKGEFFTIRDGKMMVGEYVLNDNYELPDKIKQIFGGTATVFQGDVRISTNIPKPDGTRAVGTRLQGPAYDAIFKQGMPYRGEVEILGKPYLTAYDPIIDSQGRIIGVLYVGVEKGAFIRHYNQLVIGFLAPILFLAILSVFLYLMARRVSLKAEQVQGNSLYFLQTLIDALPTPVFYKDRDGIYLGCNSAFEKIYNTSRSEIVGKTVHDIAGTELAAVYAQMDKQLFEAPPGVKQQYESKVLNDGLGERDVIYYKARYYERDGQLGGLVGAILDITDRKQTEDRLRASERQMYDIISFLPDATWVVDCEGRVVTWNKACEELTSVKAEDIIGRGGYLYAMPFYGKRRPMLIDGVLANLSLQEEGYTFLEQDQNVATAEAYAPFLRGGRGAYVWGTARRLYDSKGQVIGAIETVRDVTDRMLTEQREHARANILEHIAKDDSIEEVLTAIAKDIEHEHKDTLCSILLVNRQGDRLMHGAAPSLPEFYNKAVNGIRIKDGAGSCGTAAFRRKRVIVADIEGHPYWQTFTPAREAGIRSCWSEPILSSSGELYGTFAIYSRKVWEPGPEEIRMIVSAANYASIAIERMNTLSALRESERKYRELVENANSIILRIKPDGKISFFNEYAQQFFGYTEAEIMGRHVIGSILPPYESSGRSMVEMIADVCFDPAKYALNENENMRKNGERVYISWANKACFAADGTLEELLCIGQDITERKKMQDLMVQSEKMVTVGGLAAGMAHELNNPVGSIVQNAQNISRRMLPDLPANQEAATESGVDLEKVQLYFEKRGINGMLDAISASCERAANIIANMLTFSRKSTNRFELAALDSLAEKAIDLAICDYDLKKQYDFKNIHLVREFDPDLPVFNMVPLEIEQVLLNLLKNAAQALRANPPGRPPVITIRTRKSEEFAIVQIEDNGSGISKEERSRIFEPFFTTKEVGIGTGLGLSISYSIIVNKHLGTIGVESTPGAGSCFTIKLPLNQPESNLAE